MGMKTLDELNWAGSWLEDKDIVPSMSDVWKMWLALGECPEEFDISMDEFYDLVNERLDIDDSCIILCGMSLRKIQLKEQIG